MIENPTTLEERFANIEELVHQYVPGLPVAWSNAKVCFGTCHLRRGKDGNYYPVKISISKPLSKTNTWATIRDTVLHEVAHALTPGHGHDKVWKAKCRELGCSDERCYTPVGSRKTSKNKVYPAAEPTAPAKPYKAPPNPDIYRYLSICDKCGKIVGDFMRRPTNTYSHSICGGTTTLVPNPLFEGKQYADLGLLADNLEKNLAFLFSRCSAVLGVALEGSRKETPEGVTSPSAGAGKKTAKGSPVSQKGAGSARRKGSTAGGAGGVVIESPAAKKGADKAAKAVSTIMGGNVPGAPVERKIRNLFVLCEHIPSPETRRALYQKLAAKYEHLEMDCKSELEFAAMDIFVLSHNRHIYIKPIYITPEDFGSFLDAALSGEMLEPQNGFYPIGFLSGIEHAEILCEKNRAWSSIRERIQARPQVLFEKWYEKELADMKNADLKQAQAETKRILETRVGNLRLEDFVRFQATGFTSMIDQLSRVGVAEKFLARYIRAVFALNECYGTQASPKLESVEAELEGLGKKPLACVKRLQALEKLAEDPRTFGDVAREMASLISELEALAK